MRRSGTLALQETVVPLVELLGSHVGFPEVVAAVAAVKNTVLLGKVVVEGEGLGIAQGVEEGNRVAVGMAAAEGLQECMSEVAVGLDEHILAAVMKENMVAD